MARPSRIDQQRCELLPRLTEVFAEVGYRRATTAELARRCDVRENILYRLWPDKKAMFVAALEAQLQQRIQRWEKLTAKLEHPRDIVMRVMQYEAAHIGEAGIYRIIFAALGETDDPEIQRALFLLYQGFHDFLAGHIAGKSPDSAESDDPAANEVAWGLIGLATVTNIVRELHLLPAKQRQRMFRIVGLRLLGDLAG